MARIALGIGTSHSPMLAIDPKLWYQRGEDDQRKEEFYLTDGRVVSFAALDAEVGGRYADHANLDNFQKISSRAQAALDRLAAAIEESEVDVLVIVGDDQEELFSKAHMPAIAVYTGQELVTHPKNEVVPTLPAWYREANKQYLMDTVYRHPAAPDLAAKLVEGLLDAGVDVAVATDVSDPESAGFGHAYGFVIGRLCGSRPIPVLPIMLNTYYPPNVPRPGRCFDVGRVIGQVIAALSEETKVGVVASGGLTHFAVDAEFDTAILAAFRSDDAEALRGLNHLALRSGNSEILNWILAAGAMKGLDVTDSEYIPLYRTSAGTGVGLGFLVWKPAAGAGVA